MLELKSKSDIEKMRKAGRITAQILREMSEKVKSGVTPNDLDKFAEKRCSDLGVIPAFKGYRNFPKCVCISVNQQVVHSIPTDTRFVDGDLVKLDFGVISDGFYGDSAVTVALPGASMADLMLLNTTKASLAAGIKAIKLGGHVGDISSAIQTVVESAGFKIVKLLGGHGIGTALHMDPPIYNFGKPNTGEELLEGMTIAIEPIVAVDTEKFIVQPDNWTTVTTNDKKSAHFEHTVLITSNGPEILTIG